MLKFGGSGWRSNGSAWPPPSEVTSHRCQFLRAVVFAVVSLSAWPLGYPRASCHHSTGRAYFRTRLGLLLCLQWTNVLIYHFSRFDRGHLHPFPPHTGIHSFNPNFISHHFTSLLILETSSWSLKLTSQSGLHHPSIPSTRLSWNSLKATLVGPPLHLFAETFFPPLQVRWKFLRWFLHLIYF